MPAARLDTKAIYGIIFYTMRILYDRQRGVGGYSLIEMTIVLFIILAFLSMSVPFFAKFLPQTGLKTAEREIGTVLRTARSYALSLNSNYNVVFDTTATPNTYRITNSLNATQDKTYQLPTSVHFTAPVTITFASNGGLASGSATSVTIVETNDATKTRTITVEAATGAVTIP